MAQDARLWGAGAAGGEPAGRVTFVLADLAREVVNATVPEQQELLAAVTASREAHGTSGRRRWEWTGGSVGSGMGPVVTAEIIYPLLTGTLGQVLGAAAVSRPWRWRRRRDVRAAHAVRVTLDAEQVDMLRSAWISYGMTLGLSRPRATVLAEAIHGALCRAMAESQARP